MSNVDKIRIAIVDDNQNCINELIEKLSFYNEIEICGYETRYNQALKLLFNEQPELVFLDIEMPGKNGFKLLNEAREKGATFSVIFFTMYSQYMVQALRDSALDYILKPIDDNELNNAIERFKALRENQYSSKLLPHHTGLKLKNETIIFPTLSGLQFLEKSRILLFRSTSGTILIPACWEVVLNDLMTISLSKFLSAKKIMDILSNATFFQINQSCIINLTYLGLIRHSTRDCELIPPYDNIKLTVSRTQLVKMKENFEVF